ncbi:DUF2637 domain-containing protein [Streptomyces sp. URMC 125]|uniref:DUF2637 domain-containing protein n=1 Tax=Streptomyces sp. URMC 125 TaxID=3423419 RepID=UPI003F1DD7E1
MTHSTALPVAPVGGWDRAAIVALGAAGCALSYDALQQMAVAIHVRGFLTYLFPLVIDGFIAYGVRALLVLATAPLRARLYVWLLFGTATAASIWANALHAVRLNQQTTHSGLRLGDTVVAVLSTLAPLALAGAVHLYILITRHHPTDGGPADHRATTSADQPAADQPTTSVADHGSGTAGRPRNSPRSDHQAEAAGRQTANGGPADQPTSGGLATSADQPSGPATRRATLFVDHRATTSANQPTADQRTTPHPDQEGGPAKPPVTRLVVREETVPSPGLESEEAAFTATDLLPDRAPQTRRRRTASPTGQEHGPASPRTTEGQKADHRAATAVDHSTAGQLTTSVANHGSGATDRPRATSRPNHQAAAADRRTANGGPAGIEDLLPLALTAVQETGRLSRRAIRPYLRAKDISISNERFSLLLDRLKELEARGELYQTKEPVA